MKSIRRHRPGTAAYIGPLALAALLLLPGGAGADEGAAFRSRVDVGIGSAAEDAFFLLLLEQGFQYEGFEAVLSGPLRLRIHDEPPAEDGVVREQDWDEPSDFARIVPLLQYSREFENGALGYHMGTWGARGSRLGYSFHAHCTDGMLEVHLHSLK